MSALSDKMRKAREVRINADKYVFVALRPTPLERQEKFRVGESSKAIMSFVVGWENVVAVSYTHLDVYKRQGTMGLR